MRRVRDEAGSMSSSKGTDQCRGLSDAEDRMMLSDVDTPLQVGF
jgi:hypothetical protein